MPGDNPLIVGGVHIYQPADTGKCLFKKAAVKVLPKEGDLNVVRYKGMIIKFPDQQPMTRNGKELTPFISENQFNGYTDIMLQGAEINGSKKADKVRSYCKESVFNFKDGGADIIEEVPDSQTHGLFPNEYNLDKDDRLFGSRTVD